MRFAFPATAFCSYSLFRQWCVLGRAAWPMSIPIGKGGNTICSAPGEWLSYLAGVFQIVGASSSCIHTSPQNFSVVYPTILQVSRSAHFRALNHYCSSIVFSNLFRNSSTAINPSYVGSSLTFVVTQCNDITIIVTQ